MAASVIFSPHYWKSVEILIRSILYRKNTNNVVDLEEFEQFENSIYRSSSFVEREGDGGEINAPNNICNLYVSLLHDSSVKSSAIGRVLFKCYSHNLKSSKDAIVENTNISSCDKAYMIEKVLGSGSFILPEAVDLLLNSEVKDSELQELGDHLSPVSKLLMMCEIDRYNYKTGTIPKHISQLLCLVNSMGSHSPAQKVVKSTLFNYILKYSIICIDLNGIDLCLSNIVQYSQLYGVEDNIYIPLGMLILKRTNNFDKIMRGLENDTDKNYYSKRNREFANIYTSQDMKIKTENVYDIFTYIQHIKRREKLVLRKDKQFFNEGEMIDFSFFDNIGTKRGYEKKVLNNSEFCVSKSDIVLAHILNVMIVLLKGQDINGNSKHLNKKFSQMNYPRITTTSWSRCLSARIIDLLELTNLPDFATPLSSYIILYSLFALIQYRQPEDVIQFVAKTSHFMSIFTKTLGEYKADDDHTWKTFGALFDKIHFTVTNNNDKRQNVSTNEALQLLRSVNRKNINFLWNELNTFLEYFEMYDCLEEKNYPRACEILDTLIKDSYTSCSIINALTEQKLEEKGKHSDTNNSNGNGLGSSIVPDGPSNMNNNTMKTPTEEDDSILSLMDSNEESNWLGQEGFSFSSLVNISRIIESKFLVTLLQEKMPTEKVLLNSAIVECIFHKYKELLEILTGEENIHDMICKYSQYITNQLRKVLYPWTQLYHEFPSQILRNDANVNKDGGYIKGGSNGVEKQSSAELYGFKTPSTNQLEYTPIGDYYTNISRGGNGCSNIVTRNSNNDMMASNMAGHCNYSDTRRERSNSITFPSLQMFTGGSNPAYSQGPRGTASLWCWGDRDDVATVSLPQISFGSSPGRPFTPE